MNKYNSNKLSQQVKGILYSRGFSHIFNWSEYHFYKTQFQNAFNKSVEIAEAFINNSDEKSDLEEYLF